MGVGHCWVVTRQRTVRHKKHSKCFEDVRVCWACWDLGCQVIVAEKCQTLFKERKNFGFYYINFNRLKKRGQLLNISKPTNFLKRPNLLFVWPQKGQTLVATLVGMCVCGDVGVTVYVCVCVFELKCRRSYIPSWLSRLNVKPRRLRSGREKSSVVSVGNHLCVYVYSVCARCKFAHFYPGVPCAFHAHSAHMLEGMWRCDIIATFGFFGFSFRIIFSMGRNRFLGRFRPDLTSSS